MRKMQSTARGGEPLSGGTPARNPILGTGSADAKGSTAARRGATGERWSGACGADAGIDFADEMLQQGLPSGFAWNSVPADRAFIIGQSGPQHLGSAAGRPRRQAPNADRPLARKTKARTAATSLKLRVICLNNKK
jgi:hypothetical protein